MKELSSEIDFCQMQLISIQGLPDGDATVKKEICEKLRAKLDVLLTSYNGLLND